VRKVHANERETATVGQVMRTDVAAHSVHPGEEARRAFEILNTSALPLAVVEQGRVVGLLSPADATKWLVLRQA
jgi:hypothetical protein